MPRLLLALAMLLVFAPAARAGELIDRAAGELQATNVYVDPDADPTLRPAPRCRLRSTTPEHERLRLRSDASAVPDPRGSCGIPRARSLARCLR